MFCLKQGAPSIRKFVKVCEVIVDSGSWENVVSKKLVKAISLSIEHYPKPYKVGWIKKGS